MRAIDGDALEKEGWSLHRTIRVDKHTEEYQTKPIAKVPTIEPEPHWIPCSERLPENIRPVIVTWKNTDPASYYQYIVGKHFTGTACYKNGKWYWSQAQRKICLQNMVGMIPKNLTKQLSASHGCRSQSHTRRVKDANADA